MSFETKILIKKEQAVTATDYIAIDVLGFEDNEQDSALTIYYEFNASLSIMHNNPITQNISTDASSYDYALTNDLSGSNPDLAIVELGGLRLRPPEGFEFDSDGSTTVYTLFQTTDTSVSSIADNELAVYKDDIKLTLGADYTFTAPTVEISIPDIGEINNTELLCKKNPQISKFIFFNFFASICKKANNYS